METTRIEVSDFDITKTYKKGDGAFYENQIWIFEPRQKDNQYSTGLFPSNGGHWYYE